MDEKGQADPTLTQDDTLPMAEHELDTAVMSFRELKFFFREWPDELVEELARGIQEDQENGYY